MLIVLAMVTICTAGVLRDVIIQREWSKRYQLEGVEIRGCENKTDNLAFKGWP